MKRLNLIDSVRGITIISMIGFHACWILWFFGIAITADQLFGDTFTVWERTICCSFIFISGFSFNLGKHHLKRGFITLGIGVLITILSLIFAYDVRDIFGVLWLLGSSQLIMIPFDKIINKRKVTRPLAVISFFVNLLIFVYLWNINRGYLGFSNFLYLKMPQYLYKGIFMTFIGFQEPNFYSVDYFSLLPWFLLYLTGYFFYFVIHGSKFEEKVLVLDIPVLSWMGRHSLIIYLAHPVILFIVIFLLKTFIL